MQITVIVIADKVKIRIINTTVFVIIYLAISILEITYPSPNKKMFMHIKYFPAMIIFPKAINKSISNVGLQSCIFKKPFLDEKVAL